jgi:UDP-N-acetylmuramoylalanine--D-glutamate ligase
MRETDFSRAGNVAILGMGREGRAAWRYLRSRYPDLPLTLIDEAPPAAEFVSQLAENDFHKTGPLSEAGLEKFDVLIKSPGISPYRASLCRAREAGSFITTPSNMWFAGHRDQKTICITGTKGKSTTSALLAHLLSASGYRVCLAGNIGRPLLDCDEEDMDWWIIELSSYQLANLDANPSVSVILNLSPEHLDWHGSERQYRRDKLRLASLAGERPLIANAADPVLLEALSSHPGIGWFNSDTGFRTRDLRLYDGRNEITPRLPEGLPGAHNLSNVAAAMTVIRTIGAPLESSLEAIASFRPLPHRLQLLGEKQGLRFINDSISSTPVATAAALEALSGETLSLIVGGLDRGVDWTPYMSAFRKYSPRAVIGIPDNGTDIVALLKRSEISPENGLHETGGLAEAVSLARELTPGGGVVLLSPGAPSFPWFRDFRDRGLQFANLCGFDLDDEDFNLPGRFSRQ